MDLVSRRGLLLLFGVPFFLVLAVVNVMRARREKENIYYLNASGIFLMALSFVFMSLNQFLPFLLLFSLAALLVFVRLPKTLRLNWEREYVKPLYEIDLSAPLNVREIFTSKAWLVMVSRWGVWKAVLLRSLLTAAIIGGVNFLLNIVGIMSMTEAVTMTIMAGIASAVYHYWQFSKVF